MTGTGHRDLPIYLLFDMAAGGPDKVGMLVDAVDGLRQEAAWVDLGHVLLTVVAFADDRAVAPVVWSRLADAALGFADVPAVTRSDRSFAKAFTFLHSDLHTQRDRRAGLDNAAVVLVTDGRHEPHAQNAFNVLKGLGRLSVLPVTFGPGASSDTRTRFADPPGPGRHVDDLRSLVPTVIDEILRVAGVPPPDAQPVSRITEALSPPSARHAQPGPRHGMPAPGAGGRPVIDADVRTTHTTHPGPWVGVGTAGEQPRSGNYGPGRAAATAEPGPASAVRLPSRSNGDSENLTEVIRLPESDSAALSLPDPGLDDGPAPDAERLPGADAGPGPDAPSEPVPGAEDEPTNGRRAAPVVDVWSGSVEQYKVGDPGQWDKISFLPDPTEWDRHDTILDGVEIRDADDRHRAELRAASVRGRSHRHYGTVRQDDYGYRVTPDKRYLVGVVSDGVSSAKLSHRAAAIVARVGGDLLVRELATTDPADLDWPALLDELVRVIIGTGKRVLEQIGFDKPTPRDVAGAMAATAVLAVVDLHPIDTRTRVHVFTVGDSAAWVLRRRIGWEACKPIKNDGAEIAESKTPALPVLPAEPGRPCELTLGPEDVLVLMTDGIGDPLGTGDTTVGRFLAECWGRPPTALDFAAQVDFARISQDDDRTVLAVWPDPRS